MKNKILYVILMIILTVMLIVLTGCGEDKNLQEVKKAGETISDIQGSDVAPKKAQEAKVKNDIGYAKDCVEIEFQQFQTDYYDKMYVQKTLTNQTILEFIKKEIGSGKELQGDFYLTIKNSDIIVYRNNKMEEKLATGKISDNGQITWDGKNDIYNYYIEINKK